MDNEFVEKITSISESTKISENEQQFDFSINFHAEKDGLIKITTDKGEFTYQLKPLGELYNEQESKNGAKEEMMSLLYQIERTIKEYDMKNHGVTDSSVVMALEKLSMKPEAPAQSEFLRFITDNLRMFMSMHSYSRSELRQSINRVLRSARRHNKIDGTRGYLNFIRENVP
jgi:hypothetical protein